MLSMWHFFRQTGVQPVGIIINARADRYIIIHTDSFDTRWVALDDLRYEACDAELLQQAGVANDHEGLRLTLDAHPADDVTDADMLLHRAELELVGLTDTLLAADHDGRSFGLGGVRPESDN